MAEESRDGPQRCRFRQKLVWRTNEGFNVQPIYRIEDIEDLKTTNSLPGQFPYVRGTRTDNDWYARQEILAEDPKLANADARDVLTRGITSLGFKVAEAADVPTLLKGIDLTKVEINIDCCPGKAVDAAKALVEYIKAQGATETFRGSIAFNPLRKALRHGTPLCDSVVSKAVALIEAVKDIPAIRVIDVDSAMFCNAGAFIYEELGYALAWGAQWMTALTEAGVSVDEAARRIKFDMGVSSNFFMEIAKFRAGRMLWADIIKQYKPADEAAAKMMVHASTSRYNQTIFDAHVNLLRSQTETMSAAVAGVDSITVTPFDAPYKNRMNSRNVSLATSNSFSRKNHTWTRLSTRQAAPTT